LREALSRLGVDHVVPVFADVTAALAHARAVPPPRRYRHRLPATHGVAAFAREVVRHACAQWALEKAAAPAEMIVTELVGNAVRHAGGATELLLTLRDPYLHLSVRDHSHTEPVRKLPDPDTGEGGRGLLLVDAVAAGWGVVQVDDGKIVWATVRR
jgi:anti-sigma regulatory factor (Ser/Thr protein kinase)